MHFGNRLLSVVKGHDPPLFPPDKMKEVCVSFHDFISLGIYQLSKIFVFMERVKMVSFADRGHVGLFEFLC